MNASKKKKPRKPSAMPEIRTQEPPPILRPGSADLEYREGFGHVWPEGRDEPSWFNVRLPVPCPACKRVYLPQHRQAVMCERQYPAGEDVKERIKQAVRLNGITKGIVAHLVCKGCGHGFQLPVRHV